MTQAQRFARFRLGNVLEGAGLSWGSALSFFVLACVLVVWKRPDALTNPQFWAEDGAVWYAQAHNVGGLQALAIPNAGYLTTLPRLAVCLCLLFPLRDAPLLMNLVGIGFQVLPAMLLLSRRSAQWGSLRFRFGMALLYLCLPNTEEIHIHVTDAHFHLAVAAFLLIVGIPAKHWSIKAWDLLLIALCGLTGPWCLVLLLIAVVLYWFRPSRWVLASGCVCLLCGLIQVWFIAHGNRALGVLGATPALLIRILGQQIFFGALQGSHNAVRHSSLAVLLAMTVFGLSFIIRVVLRASLEWKLFVLYASAMLAAALRSPLIIGPGTEWQLLSTDFGARYWLLPMLMFVWSAAWCFRYDSFFPMRVGALLVFILFLRGLPYNWHLAPLVDYHFREYADLFEQLPEGSELSIPINPPGWGMRLIKAGLDTSASGDLQGSIDEPPVASEVDKNKDRSIAVRGWAYSRSGINSLSLYVDKRLVGPLSLDDVRPDIEDHFHLHTGKPHGWRTSLALDRVSSGEHLIIVKVQAKDGATRSFVVPIRTIER